MVNYNPPKVDYKARRKSVTIPDQSLSIQEIVKRYVRGIPVDVQQRPQVYVDQQDDDLEKLSRMDFGEKAEYAAMLAEQARKLSDDFEEMKRSAVERKAARLEEEKKRQAQAQTPVEPAKA